MADKELDITYFIAFCIEQYKNRNNMSGADVMNLFVSSGVAGYLRDCYEVLHTQSIGFVMADIDEMISKNREVVIS